MEKQIMVIQEIFICSFSGKLFHSLCLSSQRIEPKANTCVQFFSFSFMHSGGGKIGTQTWSKGEKLHWEQKAIIERHRQWVVVLPNN